MSKKLQLSPGDAPPLSETKEVDPARSFASLSHGLLHEGPTRAIPGLIGRKAVIVTDDRDLNIERKVTNIVLEDAGAGSESGPIGYSEFFSSPPSADILILRSSRLFSLNPERLVSSLNRFRQDNPKAAVMVCTFEHSVIARLEPLEKAGVVNLIEARPPCDDHALLQVGAGILGKLESL